ncbi:excitatory amino acid transporter 2-like isoform X2 [Xenia sp. Carnegie-2017]|uniref:excitatory amino acid transporter 2-like isoform X2 n=1 Tax=Xenia sp. Carnegie-2017 TaxID=2897299 RepID=UPI001F049B5F|nr:excitatory amino acid transporter 2-like isoform X2 [Xenia sp. Carnegie-2017]
MTSRKRCYNGLKNAKQHMILFFILFGVLCGFLLGSLLHGNVQSSIDPTPKEYAILLLAVAELESKQSGKLGRRTLLYYLMTTMLAAILGSILVICIKPGNVNVKKNEPNEKNVEPIHSVLDLIRNMFPDNLIQAAFSSVKTKYKTVKSPCCFNETSVGSNSSAEEMFNLFSSKVVSPWLTEGKNAIEIKINVKYEFDGIEKTSGTNMLGLVVFSVLFGYILGGLGENGKLMIDFFKILFDVIMNLVTMVIWLSPVGICSMVAGAMVNAVDITGVFKSLALYIGTCVTGLVIHAFIFYPILYFIFTRKNPLKFFSGMITPMVTAFGTSSSAATLPVTISSMEKNNKISTKISRFVLPLGATLNMDGSALYEAVTAMYVAQLNNYELTFGRILLICIVATFVSTGAAGTPAGGLVYIIIVLEACGLPTEDIGPTLAVEWFLDRVRTAVNVMGDCYCAGVMAHCFRNELDGERPEDETQFVIENEGTIETTTTF